MEISISSVLQRLNSPSWVMPCVVHSQWSVVVGLATTLHSKLMQEQHTITLSCVWSQPIIENGQADSVKGTLPKTMHTGNEARQSLMLGAQIWPTSLGPIDRWWLVSMETCLWMPQRSCDGKVDGSSKEQSGREDPDSVFSSTGFSLGKASSLAKPTTGLHRSRRFSALPYT